MIATASLGTRRHLWLGTLSFALAFAAWGLMGAAAPELQRLVGLDASRTALLVSAPVLLGALARIPVGLLADRWSARGALGALLLFAGATAAAASWLWGRYGALLGIAVLLGVAGAAFAAGVAYVSRWTPPERQGTALGIFGLGNAGQSAAVFLGPVLAAAVGWPWVFRGTGLLLAGWAILFVLLGRDAPRPEGQGGAVASLRAVTRRPLAWALGLFYALTFGGFVAFSIYLPTLLRDRFALGAADAGFRAAGFVVLATLARPAGGWLADRIGGARVLSGVFLGIVPFALLLAWPAMLPFTVGALGCAALLGLGNGAVFRLVPTHFPAETGTVGGLVGALGGLGGFVPPLLLGELRDRLGVVWPGFVLLAAASLGLWLLNLRLFMPHRQRMEEVLPAELRRTADRLRAGAFATLVTGLLVASVVVGSRNLQNFDPALVIYTFAVVFAAWGVAYHYFVWLQKPPTRVYWRRGWEAVRREGLLRGGARTALLAARYIGGQGFIHRRSALRWWMHQLLFWGCVLAAAITFPLVFGWIHFETAPGDQSIYVAHLFGFPAGRFRLGTVLAWLVFHVLDISAFMVLGGIGLALWRRMRDRGAQAVQSFTMDFFPLFLLMAISVTGLALTVSSAWLRGASYGFLAILHAIVVIAALLYLPFGKFFHLFQRPAQLGVKLYHRQGDAGEGAHCARCGQRFASRLHVNDLEREVLPALGFDYTMPGPAGNWQELCPACKRVTLASAQLRLQGASHG